MGGPGGLPAPRRGLTAKGRQRGQSPLLLALLTALSLCAPGARSEEAPATGSDYGGVGLIEMRNARFRPDGTLEAGASLRRQRRFWFASFQALPWLETTFRVAERLDATQGSGTTSDRALDLKIRLLPETDWTPAVALGFQDMIGTGLYADEYLVASKRWWDLDFTLGIGWGRLGTGADFDNPLIGLSRSFADRPRSVGQGGTVRTGTRVAAILCGRDRAVGVRLADGTEITGAAIVSAADPRRTFVEWLQSPPAGASSLSTEAFTVIEQQVKQHYGVDVLPTMSTGASDMAQIRSKGIQCYGIGPAIDSEDGPKGFGAHSDQERILEAELHRFVRYQYDIVMALAGAK